MHANIEECVRFARPGDLPHLCELDHTADRQSVERLIAQQQFIVAELNDAIVGLIRLEYIWTVRPYIGLIWIAPDSRKRGLSRRLLAYLCEYLSGQGHQVLFSSSQADEPEPQAWHRHVGFVDSGRVEGVNAGGVDEVIFRLDIADYV